MKRKRTEKVTLRLDTPLWGQEPLFYEFTAATGEKVYAPWSWREVPPAIRY